MNNSNKAIGLVVGIVTGAVVGLASMLIYEAISEEKARNSLKEQERKKRYRSAEYAEGAKNVIAEARRRAIKLEAHY
jgi:gas vesicle protein